MSREVILSLISRFENLANGFYGASFEECNSLLGQIEGTVASIRIEFNNHGISPEIPELQKLGYMEFGPDNIGEAVRILQNGAARYRGMAERL